MTCSAGNRGGAADSDRGGAAGSDRGEDADDDRGGGALATEELQTATDER